MLFYLDAMNVVAEGVFDEIIAGCSQLSPGAAFLEECRAMDDDDEVQGL